MSRRAPAGAVLALMLALAGCGGEGPPAGAPAAPPEPGFRIGAGLELDPPAAAGALGPDLARASGAVHLSWLEPLAAPADGHRLRVARLVDGRWSDPVTVVEGDDFFANWADFPALVEGGDGALVVHWLARTAEPVYAYSIFLARSTDGGASWSPLGQLNDDLTPTEHGFVSWAPEPGGARAFWLDGRAMVDDGPMALRTALIDGAGIGPAEVLDPRVCECCSTDAAVGPDGPLVVYRDRRDGEIRDISLVRRTAAGWSEPRALPADGWEIAGCPVNGPEIAVAGERAAAAWFTAAAEAPAVKLAFSDDGAASFGEPLEVDADGPLGRVDLVLDDAGGAVVSWIGAAGEEAAVRLRRVARDGRMGEPLEVAAVGSGRTSGFPRLLRQGDTLYLAWVDIAPAEGARLRLQALPLAAVPEPAAS